MRRDVLPKITLTTNTITQDNENSSDITHSIAHLQSLFMFTLLLTGVSLDGSTHALLFIKQQKTQQTRQQTTEDAGAYGTSMSDVQSLQCPVFTS